MGKYIFHVCNGVDDPCEMMELIGPVHFTDGTRNEYYECPVCRVMVYIALDSSDTILKE